MVREGECVFSCANSRLTMLASKKLMQHPVTLLSHKSHFKKMVRNVILEISAKLLAIVLTLYLCRFYHIILFR